MYIECDTGLTAHHQTRPMQSMQSQEMPQELQYHIHWHCPVEHGRGSPRTCPTVEARLHTAPATSPYNSPQVPMLVPLHIRALASLQQFSGLFKQETQQRFKREPIEPCFKALEPINTDDLLIKDKYRTLRDDYRPPKYPLVLCHGLSGFDTLTLLRFPPIQKEHVSKNYEESHPNSEKSHGKGNQYETDLQSVSEQVTSNASILVNYWHGIEQALTKAGAKVIIAKVPPFATISERAQLLDQLLTDTFANSPERDAKERVKINLVGHSMGGLDARYLISQIQTKDSPYEVVSLTTVSTPHHGSEVADFVMRLVRKDPLLEKLCPKAIPQLTTHYMSEFNSRVQNDPSVTYFSYGALMHPSGIRLFRATYEILKSEIRANGGVDTENDGMVSVRLSMWGNYLGTLDDVDHLDLINWTNRVRATVDELVFNQSPSFNPIALYLDIADNLSQRGF